MTVPYFTVFPLHTGGLLMQIRIVMTEKLIYLNVLIKYILKPACRLGSKVWTLENREENRTSYFKEISYGQYMEPQGIRMCRMNNVRYILPLTRNQTDNSVVHMPRELFQLCEDFTRLG